MTLKEVAVGQTVKVAKLNGEEGLWTWESLKA